MSSDSSYYKHSVFIIAKSLQVSMIVFFCITTPENKNNTPQLYLEEEEKMN